MKKNKLLGFDLDELIKASLSGLFEGVEDEPKSNWTEKLKQASQVDKAKKRKNAYSNKEEGGAGDESEDIKPAEPVKVKQEKLPEVNAEAIADKINTIRSGKSLKEDETMSALKSYFEKLNGPERIALYAFLSGLEKVLGDGGKDVKTPHAAPFNIDMEQEKPKEQERKSKGSKEPSKGDADETPIIVGESANKSSIFKVIKSNRRQ